MKMLTIKDVAQSYGVHIKTVYKWVYRGIKQPGGKLRLAVGSIEQGTNNRRQYKFYPHEVEQFAATIGLAGDDLLTLQQIADMMHRNVDTVRLWISVGIYGKDKKRRVKLPTTQCKYRRRVKRGDFEAFLALAGRRLEPRRRPQWATAPAGKQ